MSRTAQTGSRQPISCVINLYNGARYIAETIESLCQQTRLPDEILIIDDGSTDDCANIAAEAGGDLVRIIRQENAGINAARNRGIQEASYPLISFIDQDDIASPDRLDVLSSALQENPEFDGVHGIWRNFWIDELVEEQNDPANQHLHGDQARPMFCAFLFRREIFDRVGLFDTQKPGNGDQNWLFASRAANANFARVEKLVLRRRIHKHNFSRTKGTDDLLATVRAWHKRRS